MCKGGARGTANPVSDAAGRACVCRFIAGLLDHPQLVRNVAIAGHLHHGKTAMMDMLIHYTHEVHWDLGRMVRTHTETHTRTWARARRVREKAERGRGMVI